MKILMLIVLALILGANTCYAQHKFPSEKYYRRMCEVAERSNCDAVDLKNTNIWELWIYFPQGINFCEKSMTERKAKRDGKFDTIIIENYSGYCVGYPDPDSKDVQISECPEHWPDNPDATLIYADVLLPGGALV